MTTLPINLSISKYKYPLLYTPILNYLGFSLAAFACVHYSATRLPLKFSFNISQISLKTAPKCWTKTGLKVINWMNQRLRVNLRSPRSTSLKDLALNASLRKSQKILWLFRFRSNSVSMATFESGGFSMALKKIATDSAESAYNPISVFCLWRSPQTDPT